MAYFGQYLELVIGKLMMGFHQYGFFAIPGIPKNRSFLGWASLDSSQMPRIQRVEDALPMFIGGFLVWHYMMSMVFFILFYNFERVIATFLLGSYEKHSRSYISISILIVANVLTLFITYLMFFFKIYFVPSTILASGAVIAAMIIYLIVMAYNIKLNNELKNDPIWRKRPKKFEKYSLAYRFQLEENLKVFQLIKKVIISIGIYVLLNILCVILSNSNFLSTSFNLVIVFLVENCILLNPLLICTVTMCSVDAWRQILIRDIEYLIGGFGLKKKGKVHIIEKKPVEKTVVARKETDIYFRDLKSMWA